jgi:tetratricopeptide (TPR) repeat protein
VGSGHFGHSFLALAGPFLIQSPLTWYTTRNCWDLSPGYTGSDHYAFHRTVSARCLYCHAGRTEVREQNEYFVNIIEQGISCERCHGPGSLHIAKHEAQIQSPDQNPDQSNQASADSPADLSIVNPARLSRQLAESVCEQCHLQGDAQVFVRDRRFDDFRPGLPLSSFRQEYRAQTHGQMTVVGHVEQMHSSACYKQSKTMTCVTCHHPHQTHQSGHVISAAEQAVAYRNACLSCHQIEHCSEQVTVRQTREDRCADCHMPKAPTELPHVAFTHHRIGLHPAESPMNQSDPAQNGGQNSSQFTLLDLSNIPGPEGPDQQRNHGLALLQLTFKTGFPDGLRQSQQLLQQAWDGGARDAAVAAALARIAEEIGWSEKSGEWSARALELDQTPSEDRCAALKIKAELDFAGGRYSSALKHLEELTRVRRDARHWFFRGMAEQNLNQTDDALRSLVMSIEIDPRNPGAHTALAAILNMKKLPNADQHQKAAEVLLKPAAGKR